MKLAIATFAAFGAAVFLYFRLRKIQSQVTVGSIADVATEAVAEVKGIVSAVPLIGEFFVDQNKVKKIAEAIAKAEGYFVSGSRSNRNNNPGDLKGNYAKLAIGDDSGFDVYATSEDGWKALYRQVTLWLTNHSKVAGSGTTIAELSRLYTTTQQNEWAYNVSAALGVRSDTKLSEIA